MSNSPRFYLENSLKIGEVIDLPNTILRHANALRLRNGETIRIFNGKGFEFEAIINEFNRKQIQVEITRQIAEPLLNFKKARLSLGIALITNDKMDLVIQKATELGVSNIIPIISKNSQKILPERLANKLQHWQEIIIASCMQCGQNYLPNISNPVLFADLLKDSTIYNLKLIMSPYTNDTTLINPKTSKLPAILLVGPEGGFSEKEILLAKNYEFKQIRLGHLILRSETAAIAGLSILNSKLDIW